MSSAERGTLTTRIFCMNAAGMYVSAMLVFKGLRFKPEWKIWALPGTSFCLTGSDLNNADVFLDWLKHFVAFIKPKKNKKLLMILDGHTCHTKTLNVNSYAKQNGILYCLTPATCCSPLIGVIRSWNQMLTWHVTSLFVPIWQKFLCHI